MKFNKTEGTISFYEELNFFIKGHALKEDIEFSYHGKRSVKDLVESYGIPHVEVDMILVNGESVSFDHIVKTGDHISVYPMFERFNIDGLTKIRDHGLREPKFVADVHLGKLVKKLRLLGFDILYDSTWDDVELADIAMNESRILLTRDRRLLMRSIIDRGLIIRSTNIEEQVIEVLERLDLYNEINPFSRCLMCNGTLLNVTEEDETYQELFIQLPAKVRIWCKEITICEKCHKLYWKGSHYEKMLKYIDDLLI
jgi:uncharacterized protein with PIN domain/sulfur carrier protein ThiS